MEVMKAAGLVDVCKQFSDANWKKSDSDREQRLKKTFQSPSVSQVELVSYDPD